jgi:multiple sugar transport system permease protein
MLFKTTTLFSTLKSKDRTTSEKIEILKDKVKKFLLGSNDKNGFLVQIVVYVLLICIGFVYLYPLLYMFITSMKSLSDILDSSVRWIPTKFYINNYRQAFMVLKFRSTMMSSLYISLVPTLCQVFTSSLVGYGFARYNFKGKKILMALMIFTFVMPPQITMMPTYVLFTELKLIGTIGAFLYPALLGQGIRSAIFILIFYSFYKQTPKALYEAAQIDGAGHIACYLKIAIPTAVPAIIVAFLFSFVWYWNETYLVSLYLASPGMAGRTTLTNIQIALRQFEASYNTIYPVTQNANGPNRINEAIEMAGTIISILPLLITYFFFQKHFVESVDRTGITGE